jgi:hypothetical protein
LRELDGGAPYPVKLATALNQLADAVDRRARGA